MLLAKKKKKELSQGLLDTTADFNPILGWIRELKRM
jgi:hypothetical protein